MQIKLLFRLMLAAMPLAGFAQTSYIRTGSGDYRLLDRLEIKTRHPLLSPSFAKPFARKTVFAALNAIVKDSGLSSSLTAVDRYHATQLLDDPENDRDPRTAYSRTTQEGYRTKTNNRYYLLAPVARLSGAKETGNADNPFNASLGADLRGALWGKFAFGLYATASKERLPSYLANWLTRYNTVPGTGNSRRHADGTFSYWDVRGFIQTPATKYIDLQLGYDRIFLGNGHRSLFLGDFSNNAAFLKINARIWKLNFQSLYMKLTPQYDIVNAADTKKYLRLNTLGIDATKWLNISFFDAVVLGRRNGFDLNYIIPVTFLRAMEHQSGSPDNALVGINLKANLSGRVQLYSQVILDEFKLSEVKARSGWWANKFGYQAGIKYVDAIGIKNLDLQFETNRVRPFTYTHFDSVSNYTHHNQPLAHPLGASFHEYIGILHYEPVKKLSFLVKAIYYKQGLDSLGRHTGNNILVNYNVRPRDYGWEVGSGNKATCMYFSSVVAYEAMRDLFIEVSLLRRTFKTELTGSTATTMISAGMRWNITRREFDF